MCMCVHMCVHLQSLHTVWPHRDQHLHRYENLTTRARSSKGSTPRELPET